MKLSILAAVLVATVSACGSDTSASVPSGADLQGTWTQSGAGFERGQSITWEDQTVVIEQADGQGFTGYKEYTPEGGQEPQRETLNGVIGTDGNVLIVDEDGTFQGQLSGDTLRGQYAEAGEDATAMNLELTRN